MNAKHIYSQLTGNVKKTQNTIQNSTTKVIPHNKGAVTTITIGEQSFDIFSQQAMKEIYEKMQSLNSTVQHQSTMIDKLQSHNQQVLNMVNSLLQEVKSLQNKVLKMEKDRDSF